MRTWRIPWIASGIQQTETAASTSENNPFNFGLQCPFCDLLSTERVRLCVAIFTLFFEVIQVAGLFSAGVVGIGPRADFALIVADLEGMKTISAEILLNFPSYIQFIYNLYTFIYLYHLTSLLIFISHLVLSHQGFLGGYFFLCWQRSQSHPILFVLVRGPKVRRGVPYLGWYLMWAVCCGFLLHWDCLRMSGALISTDG